MDSQSDVTNQSGEIGWMNQQLFSVSAQKTKGNPFQTVKNVAEDVVYCGDELLCSRRQRVTERAHHMNRVTVCTEVLPRMDMWEAAVKRTRRRHCPRGDGHHHVKTVPTDSHVDLRTISRCLTLFCRRLEGTQKRSTEFDEDTGKATQKEAFRARWAKKQYDDVVAKRKTTP